MRRARRFYGEVALEGRARGVRFARAARESDGRGGGDAPAG